MDQDEKELRELVESDKKSVINFLDEHGLKELHSNITVILENLLYKITNQIELVSTGSNLDTSSTCPHFQLIKTIKQQGNLKVKIVPLVSLLDTEILPP